MQETAKIYANMELFITLRVSAGDKGRALQEAKRILNRENARIDGIRLTDGEGNRHSFRVIDIKYMQWLHVQPSDVSRSYLVSGRIELVLLSVPGEQETPPYTNLSLIESRFTSKPVLILSAGSEKLAVLVNRQLLKWSTPGG